MKQERNHFPWDQANALAHKPMPLFDKLFKVLFPCFLWWKYKKANIIGSPSFKMFLDGNKLNRNQEKL